VRPRVRRRTTGPRRTLKGFELALPERHLVDPPTSPYDALGPDALRGRDTVKWTRFDDDVLALWVAEMDFPTAPVVKAAIRDAVEREQFGYSRLDIETGLPDATATWSETRYGWEIDPRRIHLLPDVLRGIELAIEAFSPRGSPVVLPTPAYMPFFEVVKILDRPLIEVPMAVDAGRFVLDLEGIEEAFRAGAGTLILCNPYNPLGRAFSAEELRALSLVVARNDARVISDEIHGPITYELSHIPYASVDDEAADHSVTMVSGSKAWNLPGLKCAQIIVTNPRDEQVWSQISGLRTHGASTIGIAANIAGYNEGAPWLDETLSYLDQNRRRLAELLAKHLPEVRYQIPEATYLAWLDFGGLRLPVEPAEYLLEKARVALNPGIAFGSPGTGCVRLNFATSRAILEEAIIRISSAVERRSAK
jgi:cysteine-S-conjugate beta-lyase